MARRVRANPGEGARLREEILVAAESLMAEAGTEEALTLRAVAARTGVSTPSVYMHFAGKDELIEAVCLRSWDELARRIRGVEDPDPFQRLGGCGRAYAGFALEYPTQYRVLMMSPTDNPAAHACFELMAAAVRDCVEAGVLRGHPGRITLGLWAAIHGCVSLLIAQPGFPWPDVDDFVDQVVRTAGLGSAVYGRVQRAPLAPSGKLAQTFDAACRTIRSDVEHTSDQ
ncbi:MAG: TetR/AcrR family transcriptional regulator [Thermoactinospora sp.]|nr:TetR/AcrR family transcriptional regulator [Thermoactinospora sp.]